MHSEYLFSRWGHSGFQELYGEETDSSETSSSEEARRHKKRYFETVVIFSSPEPKAH